MCGQSVSYDLDGNMLSNGDLSFTYDSANRLTSAGLHTYTYNVENVRISNLFDDFDDTTYVYDTRTKLSKLLMKTSEGFITKYVYGKGLIGEESDGTFKTYHFDCRGSTIAITNTSGTVTDTFTYDTYGKLLSRTGTTETPFMYDGRDGVLTDDNGLLYMRARYYSPDMRRFVNSDIIAGKISNAITLNRYAYANGNPVSNIDPLGLSAERGTASSNIPDYTQAIFVSNFNYPFPINITGHTQLYFWDNNNKKWYKTEFAGSNKSNATVTFKPPYDPVTGLYSKDAGNCNYVIINGDFNDSVALAEKYASNGFGRYNFLYHNCADYTNELLDVADIDGMFTQILSEGNALIAIPVTRELILSFSSAMDSGVEWVTNELIETGNSMVGTNIAGDIAGNLLVSTGNFIDDASNFIGDAVDVVNGIVGEVVDVGKAVCSTVTNSIADGAQAVWDFISFWD